MENTEVENTCALCGDVFYFCIPQKYCPNCKSKEINFPEMQLVVCAFCGYTKLTNKPLKVCPHCKRYYTAKPKTKREDLTCLRCNLVWSPRKDKVKCCPDCKSPYWNTPRKTELKEIPLELQALYEHWLKNKNITGEEVTELEPKELDSEKLFQELDSVSEQLEEELETEEEGIPVELTPDELMDIWDDLNSGEENKTPTNS